MEKEDMIGQFEKEKEELENQLSNLQRERDNSLLMAENDKQQVNTSDWVTSHVGGAWEPTAQSTERKRQLSPHG